MTEVRTAVLAVIVVTALFAVPLSGGSAAVTAHDSGTASHHEFVSVAPTPLEATAQADPATNETVGYVEGYRYDDELAVDEREGAALSDAELEAVVYRSMARVEELRGLTFEDEVDVEVISRTEFDEHRSDLFVDASETDRLTRNVQYEALFMVDRDTDALEEYETIYGGAVGGYYDPRTDQVVLVSDSPDSPEVDEAILGHELLHALQDQQFGLGSYEKTTRDRAHATDGLIEGDAVLLERAYAERCEGEWSCVQPAAEETTDRPSFNTGLFLTLYHPYNDGPEYVEHLRESGGWDAVDAAYDEPPASSAEVIRPGEDREPAAIDYEDRSSDRWEPLSRDGHERVGEAGMAAMFMHQALEAGEDGVLETGDVYDGGSTSPYVYDHEVTDGWAGDELVVYTTGAADLEESAYVWETEWLDEGHAEQFLAGYLALLESHGADPVDDRADTYVIDGEEFPGAYALETDGDSVTIVRAPTVDELSEVRAGSGEEGEDTIDTQEGSSDGNEAADGSGGADENEGADGTTDRLPGFGLGTAVAAVLGLALLASRRT